VCVRNDAASGSVPEAQGGGAGEASVAKRAQLTPANVDQQIDAVLDAGLDAYDRQIRDPMVLATNEGTEGRSGSQSDVGGPKYDSPDPGKRHTPDQEAAVDLAKDAQRRGGITKENPETLVKWGKEVGFDGIHGPDSHGPETHDDRDSDLGEHIHVGPINHIPVLPTTTVPPPSPALVGGIMGVGVLYYLWPILAL
jgi:hypothetical protein